jgi:hypothetical protein
MLGALEIPTTWESKTWQSEPVRAIRTWLRSWASKHRLLQRHKTHSWGSSLSLVMSAVQPMLRLAQWECGEVAFSTQSCSAWPLPCIKGPLADARFTWETLDIGPIPWR